MTSLQRSLFGSGEPTIDPAAPVDRRALDRTSWVDVVRGYLLGADTLFDVLVEQVPWRQGRRWMYERVVDDPRLSHWVRRDQPRPHPVLDAVGRDLGARYGVTFGSVGLNYYRDGLDSVAPHRDRELRDLADDALVAIVTLGARRPFLIRPHGGGSSIDVSPGSGDLLVMGGRCQVDFEHGVPKVKRAGPRISLSYRWAPTGAGLTPLPSA